MDKFEYRTELVKADSTDEQAVKQFNEYGQEGWEVIYTVAGDIYGKLVRLWMKRKIV